MIIEIAMAGIGLILVSRWYASGKVEQPKKDPKKGKPKINEIKLHGKRINIKDFQECNIIIADIDCADWPETIKYDVPIKIKKIDRFHGNSQAEKWGNNTIKIQISEILRQAHDIRIDDIQFSDHGLSAALFVDGIEIIKKIKFPQPPKEKEKTASYNIEGKNKNNINHYRKEQQQGHPRKYSPENYETYYREEPSYHA